MTALVWAGRRRPKLAHAASKVRSGQASRLATQTPSEHAHHPPDHGKHDAGLAGVVIVMLQPFWRRLRCVVRAEHHKNQTGANCQNDKAMHAKWIVSAGCCHRQASHRNKHENRDCKLTFACCELCDHIKCSPLVEHKCVEAASYDPLVTTLSRIASANPVPLIDRPSNGPPPHPLSF